MSQDSAADAQGPPSRRRRGGLLRALGLARGPAEAAVGRPGEAEAAALRSQAELFQTLTVGDIMTPRADIRAVELSTPFASLVAIFVECEHTRLPVYKESLDDPVGVVHLKDVFRLLSKGETAEDAQLLARIKRPTLYVPPVMRAADLLVMMKAERIHLAMVIDEFGGVDGIASLEDVIEGVVGEIDDEHDEAELPQIVERPPGVFEVDGRTPLEDLKAALKCDLADEDLEEEIETAAGLVVALAGRVPQRGEVISHAKGFEFEIADADPRRVKRLRVRRNGDAVKV